MKRIQLFLIILLLVLFIGLSVIPSSGINLFNELYKINTGETILYVGGVEPGNYSTIQSAIDDANPGDTIFVYDESSPYFENIYVYKNIKLIGENKNTTIINGIDYSEPVVVISSVASNVLVTGFTITDKFIGLYGCIGIYVYGNNNIIHENKIIFNEKGIELDRESDKNTITENIILHNSIVGIYDEGDNAENIVKWNIIGGNGRENPDIKQGGLYKHLSGGIYHHNDFDLNWGANAYTEASTWGIWDDDSEGNYWDNWESNPGYPNVYIISGSIENQIDNYPSETPYFNHTIVCITESSYETEPGEVLSFLAEVNKPSSSVSWLWEFGDGTTSTSKSPRHTYNKSGIYEINVTVKDIRGVYDTDKSIAYIGIPPNKPTIKGRKKGRPHFRYEYSIVATDSDSKYISYFIDWGDGFFDYIDPVPCGEVVKIYHDWDYKNNFTISVKAIDETLRESEWAYLDVQIPRNKVAYNSLFLRFLDIFPMLERLLNFLR